MSTAAERQIRAATRRGNAKLRLRRSHWFYGFERERVIDSIVDFEVPA